MLHWGVAMTRFHPLWPGRPSADDYAVGSGAVARAQEIGGQTEREKAYINAASAFYEGEDTPWNERISKWSSAQLAVYEQNPDDVDGTALFALSHLATADKTDQTFKNQREAGAMLEVLHADNPDHPAGFHYLIHAYDNPALAMEAAEVSQAYDKLAPDVPHALHMPTHIFTRMGMWPQSIDWNHRSADAALAQPAASVTTAHYAHAVDYLVYAYLQLGKTEEAQQMADEMEAITDHQDSFAAAYALAASGARIPMELDDWENAANTPVNENPSITWTKFPAMTAITEFARGLGAARSGDAEAAMKSIDALGTLRERLIEQDQTYWATLVSAQQKSVDAWRLQALNMQEEALDMMMAAADIEDSVDKHPVTPGAVLPARELLGDMLTMNGDHAAALEAYRATLSISPNRARSLKSAIANAKELGKEELIESYEDQLENMLSSDASGD